MARGWIEKHNNSYRYKIELDKNVDDSKRKTISKSGFKTKSEAKTALNKILVSIDEGKYIEDKKTTIKTFLDDWIESYKSNIAPTTYIRYVQFCNTINENIGDIELLKLTPLNIQKMYSKLLVNGGAKEQPLSKSTVLKTHRMLNLALKQAVAWKMLDNNPCTFVKPPRADKIEMQVWNEDQVKYFLSHAKGEYFYNIFVLAIGTGMREGELCGLKWDCVDINKGEIYVKRKLKRINSKLTLGDVKTKSSRRRITISKDLVNLLRKHELEQKELKMLNRKKYNDEGFVFAWEDGRPVDPNYLSRNFPKIIAEYELPIIRFHDLRHTHATLLLLKEENPKIVSERLGHSSIGITLDTYSHVLPNMQRSAAEKLNDLFSAL